MVKTINERFLDFQVIQQARWIRYMNREVREALATMARADARIRVAMLSIDDSTPYTQARIQALKLQIENIITQLHTQELAPQLIENVREAATTSAKIEADAFKRILPAGLDITTPNLGVIADNAILNPFNGATTVEWIETFKQRDLERTWRSILDGITTGETNQEIVRRLLGTASQRHVDGDRVVSRRGLEALVRTSINHAANQGRQTVWEHNSDLISGVRWVSSLDSRTTPICRDRDGHVGPTSPTANWTPPDGAPALHPPTARPPAHINCRSTTVAVTKSWEELGFDMDELPEGTRASMDGQVPAKLTYYEWLDRQGAQTQKEILGAGRYKAWKTDGVTPDRFVNSKGRVLTLKEIDKLAQND